MEYSDILSPKERINTMKTLKKSTNIKNRGCNHFVKLLILALMALCISACGTAGDSVKTDREVTGEIIQDDATVNDGENPDVASDDTNQTANDGENADTAVGDTNQTVNDGEDAETAVGDTNQTANVDEQNGSDNNQAAGNDEQNSSDAEGDVTSSDTGNEKYLDAVKKYCLENNPDLEGIVNEGEYTVYWEVESFNNNEVVVLYRSYTGAQVRYYINKITGDTYVTEFVPGITDEEQVTGETFNIKSYIVES